MVSRGMIFFTFFVKNQSVPNFVSILKALKEKGIEVKADQKLKDFGAANDSGPMQIYEMVVEV
jgi:hypothetical protein